MLRLKPTSADPKNDHDDASKYSTGGDARLADSSARVSLAAIAAATAAAALIRISG